MITTEQKSQIEFIEEWLSIEFDGDIDNVQEVKDFIDNYFDDAKLLYEEIRCEYESYLSEKL